MEELEYFLKERSRYMLELEKNIKDCKRIQMLKLDREEQERHQKLKLKYAAKREKLETTPHNGNLGLQQKIAQIEKEIAICVAEIESTTK